MYPTVVTEQDSELPLHHVFCFQLKLASFDYIWAGWSCASSSSFQQTWPLPDWCLKEAERFVPRSSSTQAHRAQESPYSDSSALHCRWWPAGECSTRLNSMHGSAYSSQDLLRSSVPLILCVHYCVHRLLIPSVSHVPGLMHVWFNLFAVR